MSKWEHVCGAEAAYGQALSIDSRTHRLKVPGGWLYREIIETAVANASHGVIRGQQLALAFVPDVEHAAPAKGDPNNVGRE